MINLRVRSAATRSLVQIVYYTVVGIVLYFAADRLLRMIERRRGAMLENRTLVFLIYPAALALTAF